MNCCCNRYTVGVSIGSIYIAGSVLLFLFEILMYSQNQRVKDEERRQKLQSEAIQNMVTSVTAAVISSLFIVAIVKKIHYLILLWLLLLIYLFYSSFWYIYITFIGAAMGGASGNTFLILLLLFISVIALQIAIFSFSVALLMRIRIENIENAERTKHQLYEKTLI